MLLRFLITGATGFVGKAVWEQAVRRSRAVKGVLRKSGKVPSRIEPVVFGEINRETDWERALHDGNGIIRLEPLECTTRGPIR